MRALLYVILYGIFGFIIGAYGGLLASKYLGFSQPLSINCDPGLGGFGCGANAAFGLYTFILYVGLPGFILGIIGLYVGAKRARKTMDSD